MYEITSCLLLPLALSGSSDLLPFVFLLFLLVLLLILFVTSISLASTASLTVSLFSGASVNGFVAGNDFATLDDTSAADVTADALLLVSASFNDETLLLLLLLLSKFNGLIGSTELVGEWNGFVDELVVVVVVAEMGDIFKNGFVDLAGSGSAMLSVLNSAVNMFNDGTLIFSIVPRFSEKCVTVTVSVVGGFAMVPLWPSDAGCLSIVAASIEAVGSTDSDAGLFFSKPADGGGVIDGKPFKNGDVGVTAPLFF